ncbi:hypothetical protein C0993_012491 [Termitomyces sp. T159_Od127]|nr:hypothetical protein C0993_012491 [Termitomyces sp. T159_Od127]
MQLSLVLFLPSLFALCPALTAVTRNSTSSPAEFSYTGVDGPLGWTRGNEVNPTCSTGTNQSPINIDGAISVAQSPVKLIIRDARLKFTNNGHTLQVTTGGTLKVGRKKYQLVQFHFHTPAEHRIDDEFFPLEMHLVFQAAGAQPNDPGKSKPYCARAPTNHNHQVKLVIGVLFEVYAFSTTQLLRSLAGNLPKTPGTTVTTRRLSFENLIENIEKNGLYTYQGSLTTPPCSEGITWLVSEKVLPVDVATYKAFKSIIKFNARYAQNTPGEENLITFAKDNYPSTA